MPLLERVALKMNWYPLRGEGTEQSVTTDTIVSTGEGDESAVVLREPRTACGCGVFRDFLPKSNISWLYFD
jgi:hypothetical protein